LPGSGAFSSNITQPMAAIRISGATVIVSVAGRNYFKMNYLCPDKEGFGFWKLIGGPRDREITNSERADAIALSKRIVNQNRYFKLPIFDDLEITAPNLMIVEAPKSPLYYEFKRHADPAYRFRERYQGPGVTEWIRMSKIT